MSDPVTVAGVAALLTASVSAAVAAYEYRLKARAERRLSDSALVENQIKLSSLFAELLRLANGWGSSYTTSDAAVAGLFEHGQIDAAVLSRPGELQRILREECTFIPIQPWASEISAISSIVELGLRHEFLIRPALDGLKFISTDPALISNKGRPHANIRAAVADALVRLGDDSPLEAARAGPS